MDRWALNAVVLSHCQRYFAAVTAVIQGWVDLDAQELAQVTTLLGNVIWARSGFVSDSREQEEARSMMGALAGTLGGRLGDQASDLREQALALVAAEECRVWRDYDRILGALASELGDQPLSPAQLNRWVWTRLFPQYAHGSSVAELQAAIRRRLGAVAA